MELIHNECQSTILSWLDLHFVGAKPDNPEHNPWPLVTILEKKYIKNIKKYFIKNNNILTNLFFN